MSEPNSNDWADAATLWTHVVTTGERITYRAGRQGARLIAEWPGLARVTCGLDGSMLRVIPALGVPRRDLTKLNGFVRALLSERRGGLGMHASAIAFSSRAVLFVGNSGQGKSTAAAEMCFQYGAKLLADDAALLEVRDGAIYVVPSESAHYLSRESRIGLGLSIAIRHPVSHSTKSAVRPRKRAMAGYPLRLVVALRFDDSLPHGRWSQLRGYSAVHRIVDGMIRFDLADDEARRRELDNVTRIYDRAPIVELARPHHNPGVGEFIVRALAEQRP